MDSDVCAIPTEDARKRGRYPGTGLEIWTLVGASGIFLKPASQKLSSSTEYWPANSWMKPLVETVAVPLPATLSSICCAFTISFVGPDERKRTRTAGPNFHRWSPIFVNGTPGTLGRFVVVGSPSVSL